MYVRFKVLAVKAVHEKAIRIDTTHEIDSRSITPENICITNAGDTVSELFWNEFSVSGKSITLFLCDDPLINTDYIVRIKNLQNVVDESLQTSYNQTIHFINFVHSEIEILSPAFHQEVSKFVLKLREWGKLTADAYQIQLSMDPHFNRLVYDEKLSDIKEDIQAPPKQFLELVSETDEHFKLYLDEYQDLILSEITTPSALQVNKGLELVAPSGLHYQLKIDQSHVLLEEVDPSCYNPSAPQILKLFDNDKNIFQLKMDLQDQLVLENETSRYMIYFVHHSFNINLTGVSESLSGQLYLRVRTIHTGHADNNVNNLSFFTQYGDWLTSTFSYFPTLTTPSELPPVVYEEVLNLIESPKDNMLLSNFTFIFDCFELYPVTFTNIQVRVKQLDTEHISLVPCEYQVSGNLLIVTPIQEDFIKENQLYTFTFRDLKADKCKVLEKYSHDLYTKANPCYGTISNVLSYIGIEADPKLVLEYLKDGSKLADYYADIQTKCDLKNMPYYDRIEYAQIFEKEQFAKNYAASKILAHARVGLAYSAGMGGKLGEIEFTPKGSLPDLTGSLKLFNEEAEKWKLALQGHKDHPADPKQTIKSKNCRPHEHTRGFF